MAYFPFFVLLEQKKGLIVGGGAVALRKTQKLLPYGPKLTVVAPEICGELAAVPGLKLCVRPFRPEDVEEMAFVIAASDDRCTNHQAAMLCRERNIPVNVADSTADSSFLFPALVRRGELSVGISTGGASPAAAQYVKSRLEQAMPEEMDDILDFLQKQREQLKESIPEKSRRSRILKAMFDGCIRQNRVLTAAEAAAIVEQEDRT